MERLKKLLSFAVISYRKLEILRFAERFFGKLTEFWIIKEGKQPLRKIFDKEIRILNE